MGYKFNPFTGNFDTTDSPNGVFDSVEVNGDVTLDDGGSFTTTLQTITPTANRTVSIPDATGTLALVAGSSGQLVYNNAGVYAGIPGSTVGASGNVTLNAASGFTGNLLDLQVGGTSRFKVEANNTRVLANGYYVDTTVGYYLQDGVGGIFNASGPKIISTASLSWVNSANANSGTIDLTLSRDDADKLAQRRGNFAQTFRVYNTYTSSTNYELGKLEWTSNVFRIGTEKGSGGGTARALDLRTNDQSRIEILETGGANYHKASEHRFYSNNSGAYTGLVARFDATSLRFEDGINISLASTTGTKIGTATTQKLGFYNATPVAQPAAVADATDAATAITQLNALLARMRDLGLIAT